MVYGLVRPGAGTQLMLREALLTSLESLFRIHAAVPRHEARLRRLDLATFAADADVLRPHDLIEERRLGPAAVDREVEDELLHLVECEVATVHRRVHVSLDRSDRIGGADARQRDQPAIASTECWTVPNFGKDDIEEHGLLDRASAPRVPDRHHLAICRFATLPPTDGVFTDRTDLCSGHMHLLIGGTTPRLP